MIADRPCGLLDVDTAYMNNAEGAAVDAMLARGLPAAAVVGFVRSLGVGGLRKVVHGGLDSFWLLGQWFSSCLGPDDRSWLVSEAARLDDAASARFMWQVSSAKGQRMFSQADVKKAKARLAKCRYSYPSNSKPDASKAASVFARRAGMNDIPLLASINPSCLVDIAKLSLYSGSVANGVFLRHMSSGARSEFLKKFISNELVWTSFGYDPKQNAHMFSLYMAIRAALRTLSDRRESDACKIAVVATLRSSDFVRTALGAFAAAASPRRFEILKHSGCADEYAMECDSEGVDHLDPYMFLHLVASKPGWDCRSLDGFEDMLAL